MKHLDPGSVEISKACSKNFVDLAELHSILKQTCISILNSTMEFVDSSTLFKYHCKCNNYDDFKKPHGHALKRAGSQKTQNDSSGGDDDDYLNFTASSRTTLSRASSVSSSSGLFRSRSWSRQHTSDKCLHRPSEEHLLKCVSLFQELFNVECLESVPTKMNEIAVWHGQLVNFKKAVQNIFDPSMQTYRLNKLEFNLFCINWFLKAAHYTIEKLTRSIQTMHRHMSDQMSLSLRRMLNSTNLEKWDPIYFSFRFLTYPKTK